MAKQAKATKSSGGDNFTRWLVIGMVSLVVASGAIFSVVGENTKANESFAILNDFKVGPTVVSTVDEANGAGITFNNGAERQLIFGKIRSAQSVILLNRPMANLSMN